MEVLFFHYSNDKALQLSSGLLLLCLETACFGKSLCQDSIFVLSFRLLLAWEFWKKSKKELAALSVYENVFFLKIGHNKVMEIIYSL